MPQIWGGRQGDRTKTGPSHAEKHQLADFVTHRLTKGEKLLAGLETPLTRGGEARQSTGPFPHSQQTRVQRDASCKSKKILKRM